MINKYIDLTLKKHDKHNDKSYLLEGIIQEFEIVVLLGSPGSGKTSILRKYANEHPNSQLLTVKEILKIEDRVKEGTKTLLLDGLDEYRSVSNDKAFVVTELGSKINKLEEMNIVISCREMDWYGEADSKALKEEINRKAVIFRVCPLDNDQKKEMAELFDIKEPQEFIEKYSKYGFLDNPQMFKMLADIYQTDPNEAIQSKTDLYLTFVRMAREHNLSNIQNKINLLESDEILKYSGYIAFFYLFTDVETMDYDFIDKICDTDNGYSKEKLEITLNTKLFDGRMFIHRTIAEFILAKYIVEYKFEQNILVSVERLISLFTKKGKVPTVLRGTYAWLCSLTGSDEFIKVDPYYQAIHGDNSFFENNLKKKIVLEVKKYAKINPYFIDFRQTTELEGFYKEELDDFLISEFNEAIIMKNHYIYFIINTIVSSDNLSYKIRDYLKTVILDSNIKSYYKRDLIKSVKDDIEFLVEVLECIKNGDLPDRNDSLKDTLLWILYPDSINYNKIVEYLVLYNERVGGYCYYLYNTDYNNKFTVIDGIYKSSYDEERETHLLLPENTEGFIEDYFLETLLKFENGLSAEEIYSILKHFNYFYGKYECIKIHSYRHNAKEELKKSEGKLLRLTNILFSMFVDDKLKESGKDVRFYDFYNFFNYKAPDNQSEVLFKKMNSNLSLDQNRNLFFDGLRHLQKNKLYSDKLELVAKEFGLEKDLYDWQNPKKQEWEIEHEKHKKEREEKARKLIEDNEEYFSRKNDEQIKEKFGDLHYIANLLFIPESNEKERYLTNETVERLKYILKMAITNELFEPELLTLESIAHNSPEANRNIDTMYYVSCALNDYSDIEFVNEDFLKYLYIISLIQSRSSNVIKGNFLECIETAKYSFTKAALKEYNKSLFESYFPLIKQTIISYTEKEDEIDNLKKIALLFKAEKDTIQDVILNNFLKVYNFKIKLVDLKLFNELDKVNEKNKSIIFALQALLEDNKEDFTINMAISLHSLFEYEDERFTKLKYDKKAKIIDYMMSQFNTEESIQHIDGVQTYKAICASFLRDSILNRVNSDTLLKLQEIRKNVDDIWTLRIAHSIDVLNQKESDQLYMTYPIEEIKNFILSNVIISKEDFFADICVKLYNLKKEIEDNRDNEKEPFHNQDGTKKTEEACRDVILHRLKDKYGYDLDLTKEKHEADNRVDINIKYRADNSFEVQVECKRDDNSTINTGITEQLIGKYFSSGVQHGIYLVFYFGDKKNKDLLLKKIKDDIPEEYKEKIKIVCIDLTLPGKEVSK